MSCLSPQPSDSEYSELLTVNEFARRAGISPSTVRRYVASGRISSWQPGGRGAAIRIPTAALQLLSSIDGKSNTLTVLSGALSGPKPRWMSSAKIRSREQ